MIKLSNFYKNKKVMITGVTGFKGSWLALGLVRWEQKYLVLALTQIKIKIYFIN